MRKGLSSYCKQHLKQAMSKEGLVYGRIDKPYREKHELSECPSGSDARIGVPKAAGDLDLLKQSKLIARGQNTPLYELHTQSGCSSDESINDALLVQHAQHLINRKMLKTSTPAEVVWENIDSTFGSSIKQDPGKQR